MDELKLPLWWSKGTAHYTIYDADANFVCQAKQESVATLIVDVVNFYAEHLKIRESMTKGLPKDIPEMEADHE